MAALKFLALAVQVRILVSQPQKKPALEGSASSLLVGIVFRLRVTIRAKQSKICPDIVFMISIYVMDVKDQFFPIPRLNSAFFTLGMS